MFYTTNDYNGLTLLRITPLIVILLAPLVLLAPVFLSGQALFWGAPLLQFGPWWDAAGQMLAAGRLPLWNPLVGMGAPLLANYQSALFYPPTWGYLLLHGLGGAKLMAWGMAPLAALHLAWAGLGMALLVRRLGLGILAQALGGLAFGLSGYLVSRAWFLSINAAAAWLPWILLCLTPDLGKENLSLGKAQTWRRRFVALTACLALQLLSGHAQTTWYTLLLAGLWTGFWSLQAGAVDKVAWFWQVWGRLLRNWGLLAGTVLLAAGIAAVQLLPTFEYLGQSQRAAAVEYDFALNYSFWPWRLLTLLAPGLFGSPVSGDFWGYANYWEDAIYIGLLPMLLAVGALIGSLRRLKPAKMSGEALVVERVLRRYLPWFSLILMALALVLALGKNTPVFPWLYRYIPTFNMFQAPTRWMIWAEFALALLAALGAERWRRPEGWGLYWTRLGTMGAVAVSLGAGIAWYNMGEVSPSFIRATALLGMFGAGTAALSLVAPPRPDEERQVQLDSESNRKPLAQPAAAGLTAGGPHEDSPGKRSKTRRILFQFKPPVTKSRPAGKPYPLRRWQWAVALFVALDLLVAAWGLNPAGPLDLYGPSPTAQQVRTMAGNQRLFIPAGQEDWLKYVRFFRFDTFNTSQDWMELRAALLPNSNTLDDIPVVNNFDPLVPGRYADWMDILGEAAPQVYSQLLGLMDVGVVETLSRTALHGVRFTELPYVPVHSWVPCARSAESPEAARQLVLSGDVDFSYEVVVENLDEAPENCQPPPYEQECSNPSKLTIIAEHPDRIELGGVFRYDSWWVIPTVWYPGWRAWVDGEPVPVWRANYLFQAVEIPQGGHSIVLAYQPVSFFGGLLASLIGLLATALIGWWRR